MTNCNGNVQHMHLSNQCSHTVTLSKHCSDLCHFSCNCAAEEKGFSISVLLMVWYYLLLTGGLFSASELYFGHCHLLCFWFRQWSWEITIVINTSENKLKRTNNPQRWRELVIRQKIREYSRKMPTYQPGRKACAGEAFCSLHFHHQIPLMREQSCSAAMHIPTLTSTEPLEMQGARSYSVEDWQSNFFYLYGGKRILKLWSAMYQSHL